MSGGIYLVQNGTELVEMTETPFENEDLFQKLLAQFPRILGGDQLDGSSAKRWLLVSREAGIPDVEDGSDRWSVDHLFVDEEAVPTFVEVKRSTDTRIRREVVGQMLDYAAHAVTTWSAGRIRTVFEAQCGGLDADQVLAEAIGEDTDSDAFWSDVDTNLKAGKIRLAFVADLFPPELRRVVEFLNVQMSPAEVVGIEIRQYVGEGLQTLVPRVIGMKTADTSGFRRRWDSDRFFADLAERGAGKKTTDVAKELLAFGGQVSGRSIDWGTGKGWGSFTAAVLVGKERFSLFSVYSTGHFSMNIGWSNARLEPLGLTFSEDLRGRVADELGLSFDRATWENASTKTELEFLAAERLDAFKGIMTTFASDIRQRASAAFAAADGPDSR
jgi:hypothetical protein